MYVRDHKGLSSHESVRTDTLASDRLYDLAGGSTAERSEMEWLGGLRRR